MLAQQDFLGAAADNFEDRIDEIAATVVVRMREEIEELREFEAPELWEIVRKSTAGCRRLQAAQIRRGWVDLPVCPEPDAEAARASAAAGTSLAAVLQAYRIGHSVALDAWLECVELTGVAGTELSAGSRTVARLVNEYDDQLALLVGAEYELETARTVSKPDAQRLRLVRGLIDGTADHVEGLDYDLGLAHVGLIVWGPRARAVLQELADASGRRLLLASAEDDVLMGWLGAEASGPDGVVVPAGYRPQGARVAVGIPGAGVEGFRRTHRQAGEAYMVAIRRPQPVTFYDDVSLEAMALRNEPVAREFARSVLEKLDEANGRSAQLRETLRAYFRSAQNGASTAAALGVHEQTVARRLQTVEGLLGCPVNARRAELELALRLESLLTL
jgi:hypothetical protein